MIQLEFPFMEDEPGRISGVPVEVLTEMARDWAKNGIPRCVPDPHPALDLAAEAREREGYVGRRG